MFYFDLSSPCFSQKLILMPAFLNWQIAQRRNRRSVVSAYNTNLVSIDSNDFFFPSSAQV